MCGSPTETSGTEEDEEEGSSRCGKERREIKIQYKITYKFFEGESKDDRAIQPERGFAGSIHASQGRYELMMTNKMALDDGLADDFE